MRWLSMDCETFLFVPGNPCPTPVCVQLGDATSEKLLLAEDAIPLLMDLLRDPEVGIVGLHIAYDWGCLCAAYPQLLPLVVAAYEAGRVRDVQVRQMLLDLAAGCLVSGDSARHDLYSMFTLAKRLLGRLLDKNDPWRLRYASLHRVPISRWPEDAKAYALTDARVTWDLHAKQKGGLAVVNEDAQARADFALFLISAWGLRTDPARVQTLGDQLRADVEANHRQLAALGLMKPNGSKNQKAIQERVARAYQTSGRPVPKTPGGEPSYAAEALLESGDQALILLAEGLGDEKLLTSFIPVLERGVRVPINPSFNVLVASGRTSCAKPNIQQLPRKGGVRECFVPRPGFWYVSVDYDTFELRALAECCIDLFGRSRMGERLNAGEDLHLALAAQLLGISYEDAKRRKGEPAVKDARQQSKAANFGYPGGMGAQTLVAYAWANYRLEITPQRAEVIRAAWMAAFPEMHDFFRYVHTLVGPAEGDVTQLQSGRVRGACGFTDGCNTLFQGRAADGAKEALWEAVKAAYLKPASPFYGSRPVAFLHDEIVAEVPIECAAEAGDELARIMCEAAGKWMPKVRPTASPALMERWYKGAEPVRDSRGRLVPWRPEAGHA